jgi:hypothetical protein
VPAEEQFAAEVKPDAIFNKASKRKFVTPLNENKGKMAAVATDASKENPQSIPGMTKPMFVATKSVLEEKPETKAVPLLAAKHASTPAPKKGKGSKTAELPVDEPDAVALKTPSRKKPAATSPPPNTAFHTEPQPSEMDIANDILDNHSVGASSVHTAATSMSSANTATRPPWWWSTTPICVWTSICIATSRELRDCEEGFIWRQCREDSRCVARSSLVAVHGAQDDGRLSCRQGCQAVGGHVLHGFRGAY